LKDIRNRILRTLGPDTGIGYHDGTLLQGNVVALNPQKQPLWDLLRPNTHVGFQFAVNNHNSTLYFDGPNYSDSATARPGVLSNDFHVQVGLPGLQSIALFFAIDQTGLPLNETNRLEMFARIGGERVKFGNFEFRSEPGCRFFLWTFDNTKPSPAG